MRHKMLPVSQQDRKPLQLLQTRDEVLAPTKATQTKRNDGELSENDRDIDSPKLIQYATQVKTSCCSSSGNEAARKCLSQIQKRVGCFTGKCGVEDFEVCIWLADFREATADCKWTNKQRAQWFLSGATTKIIWQRTLGKEVMD